MKVGVVLSTARGAGGIGTYGMAMCDALQAHVDGLTVIADPDQSARLKRTHEKVHVSTPLRSGLHRILWERTALPRVASKLDIDVLWIISPTGPVRCDVPVVLTAANLAPYEQGPSGLPFAQRARFAAMRHLSRQSARRSAAVVALSETGARRLVRHGGFPSERTFGCLPGMENPRLSTTATRLGGVPGGALLSVGHIHRYKDYGVVIRAMSEMGSDAPPLRIVGRLADRRYVSELRDLIQSLGLRDRVELVGPLPVDQLGREYASAGTLVFMSRAEMAPLTLGEAMSFGLPIVAARASAIPEVGGSAPLYFNPDSVADTVEAIRGALDPAARTRLVEASLARAAEVTWDAAASKLSQIFEKALAPR